MLKGLRPAENPIDSVKAEVNPFFSPPLGRNPGRWCFSLTGLTGLTGHVPPAHLPAQALSPSSAVLIIHLVFTGGDQGIHCRQITCAGRPFEQFLGYIRDEGFGTLLDLFLKAPIAQAKGPHMGIPVCLPWRTRCLCLGIIISVFLHGSGPGPPRPFLPSLSAPFCHPLPPKTHTES